MSDLIEDIVIPTLQKIQKEISLVRADTQDLKIRVGNLETLAAHTHGMLAHHQSSMDRISERLERLENRAGLADA